MKRFLSIFSLLLLAQLGIAQMAFQNKTSLMMKVALAYYKETPQFSGWISEGWYYVKPGAKVVIIDKPLNSQYYYYYAESVDSSIEFRGNIVLKVGDNKFSIENADQKINFKDKKHRFFKQIDTENQKKYLVVLHKNYPTSK